eukprot:TRINITY_DN1099_c0_g1_i1.p1 TRINITY_DN1099_c0_g1~~TRINITY_DN1099_c0_g1_i1.p1  ORF type:complete len:224 (-),score=46.05 TRINITY_DN1099_c0_g1_i1:63-707(-)
MYTRLASQVSRRQCTPCAVQTRSVHGLSPFPELGPKRDNNSPQDYTSRNYNYMLVASCATVGTVMAKSVVTTFLSTLQPARNLMAVANVEVDLSRVPEGQSVTLEYRGKPLFVRHREQWEIDEARAAPLSEMIDPQEDADRVQNPKYLVLLGICTHLGCVPLGQSGLYHGWFCPCHGSHYDTSGRIRAGPAPLNLEVPPYKFISENTILVGDAE